MPGWCMSAKCRLSAPIVEPPHHRRRAQTSRILTSLTFLACDCPHVTDAGLEHLKGLRRLFMLSLQGTAMTDAGLVHLEALTELHTLVLCNTRITDAGLEHIKAMHQLSTLNVENTDVTAEGLRKLKQTLHRLHVAGPGHTFSSPASFDPHPARHERTRIEDDPAAVLAIKRVARSMEMDETGCVSSLAFREKVTDDDLKHLAGLACPNRLYFPSEAVLTDAGLGAIGKVKTLTGIHLNGFPLPAAD